MGEDGPAGLREERANEGSGNGKCGPGEGAILGRSGGNGSKGRS